MNIRLALVGSCLAWVAIASVGTARAAEPLAGLEEHVNRVIGEWEVPGLALAIVKDDAVVFARGFGVRKLGEERRVDEQTVFAIGSSSKAFTAAALAMLVDEGKLKWDDPATKHLPTLELYDPYATRELTVRDLLCHRGGLPRGDLLWYGTTYDRAEILRRLRRLPPEWSFRSRFGYQNIMFLAAGEIVPRLAGLSWDDFVKQRIFLPLGMKSSSTSVRELPADGNTASPHVKIADRVASIAWRNIDNVAPAGSINSTVADMAQWVRLQLSEGAIGDRRLISVDSIREMHSPHTILNQESSADRSYPDAHFLTYGLGWFLHDYHGRKIVEHGGAIDGMRAQVALIPEEKLGLVILANRGGTDLLTPLMFHVFDQYLGISKRNWNAEFLARAKKRELEAREALAKLEAQRVRDTRPSLPLAGYAGTFENDLYGEAAVKLEGEKLVLDRGPAFVADLEHWHFDTFRAVFRDPSVEPILITFRLDAAGKVAALEQPRTGLYTLRAAAQ